MSIMFFVASILMVCFGIPTLAYVLPMIPGIGGALAVGGFFLVFAAVFFLSLATA